MSRSPNTLRLHQLMTDHELKRSDVADMLGCQPKTVSCWRSESPRPIPDYELHRLELMLEIKRLSKQLAYYEAKLGSARRGSHVTA